MNYGLFTRTKVRFLFYKTRKKRKKGLNTYKKIKRRLRSLHTISLRNYIEFGYGRLRKGLGAKTSVFATQ